MPTWSWRSWKGSESPGAFVTTTRLNDNSTGDRTTNASGNPDDIQWTFASGGSVFVEGRVVLDAPSTLTSVSMTGQVDADGPNTTGTWQFAWSTDDITYTVFASGSAGIGTWTDASWSGSLPNVLYIQVQLKETRPFASPQMAANLTDLRFTVAAANEIPQCSTRTFSEEGALTPKTSRLWEIWNPAGYVIDWGDSYTRFGLGGWGVISPGLSGTGSITVTCPGGTLIAEDYRALTTGASVTFDVIEGECPGTGGDPGVFPTMQIHSTGILYVQPKLLPPTLTRRAKGTAPTPTYVLANLQDASPATIADFGYTDANNRGYLEADFGASKAIGDVKLRNVTCSGTVAVYVSASSITNGDFSGATALTLYAGSQPASGAPLSFQPSGGGTVSGRYVYVVCTSAALSFGDLDIRGERVEFGVMQNFSLRHMFARADLRGPCWVNEFPVSTVHHDADITLTARMGSTDSKILSQLTGGTWTTDGTNDTITNTETSLPTTFNIDLELRTPAGKIMRATFYEVTGGVLPLEATRDQFVFTSFTGRVRPDIWSFVGRYEFEQ